MKPLLPNITPELIASLNSRGSNRNVKKGSLIFDEGDKALFLPVIISGKVKMLHFLEGGKEVIIGIFSDGEMFAVPPVFDGAAYPATAVAMEDTKLLLIRRAELLELLGESAEFSLAIIGWMCEMLREKTATIQNLATASPEHRIAHVLYKLAEKDWCDGQPVKITLRRQDIAEMAGLTTETAIRVIRRLAQKGLIRIEHGKISVESIISLRDFLASRG